MPVWPCNFLERLSPIGSLLMMMRTTCRCRIELLMTCLLATVAAAATARAGTTTTLTNFGSNPKNLPMYLYTPSNVGAKPPL